MLVAKTFEKSGPKIRGGWPENYPQGLWNVETEPVEQNEQKFSFTGAVEKMRNLHTRAVEKNRCRRKEKTGYPHKFPLRLLLLPKLLKERDLSDSNTRKEYDDALYL